MAIYDGFFDAALNEETNAYDRAYDAGTFTEYFEQFIGSGVCIYNNPDSMMVGFHGGNAVVAPGYLFIQGYWLKNDGPYEIPLPGAGVYAVAAHLNIGLRMVEIIAQAKASPEVYPDSLILAYVTVDAAGAGTVEDTRRTPGLCGVVDAMGALSDKVAYAVDYIDNEIAGKLQQAEADIAAQAVLLDAKIVQVAAEVDKLAPPPIGTVKFSASRDVGPEWLRCDGRFINEADYPELVAALGKLTPGIEEFKELLCADSVEQMSNCVVHKGIAWVYLLKRKKLIGITSGGVKKEIAVTGADALVELPTVDTVLSICDDAVYLAQNSGDASAFTLLEFAGVAGDSAAISMTELPISTQLDSIDTRLAYPEVTGVDGSKRILLGVDSSTSAFLWYLHVAKWTTGDFASAAVERYEFAMLHSEQPGFYVDRALGIRIFSAYLSMSHKNSGELFFPMGYVLRTVASNTTTFWIVFDVRSQTRQLYGKSISMSSDSYELTTHRFSKSGKIAYGEDKYWDRFVTDEDVPPINIVAIAANNEYLYKAEIINQQLQIEYGKYNPKTVFDWRLVGPKLPSRASVFKDAAVHLPTQNLWFIFVGTGILFTDSLSTGEFGYLDTQEKIGIITMFGSMDYDIANNIVWISGVNTKGEPKVAQLKLPDLYDYANDGAWLPMIASDGVPAYIKAKEPAAVEEG